MEGSRAECRDASLENCEVQGEVTLSCDVLVDVAVQVTHWPKDDYGKFFNGDSYILLNTYKEKDTEVSTATAKELVGST